jgi:hypothetical protein
VNWLAHTVTPAKAGIQKSAKILDSGFHRNDVKRFHLRAEELKLTALVQTKIMDRNQAIRNRKWALNGAYAGVFDPEMSLLRRQYERFLIVRRNMVSSPGQGLMAGWREEATTLVINEKTAWEKAGKNRQYWIAPAAQRIWQLMWIIDAS